MSVFAGLDTEAYDRQYTDAELIKRIANYFLPYRKRVLWVTVFVTIVALAGVGQPIIVARGIGMLGEESTLILAGLLVAMNEIRVCWFLRF